MAYSDPTPRYSSYATLREKNGICNAPTGGGGRYVRVLRGVGRTGPAIASAIASAYCETTPSAMQINPTTKADPLLLLTTAFTMATKATFAQEAVSDLVWAPADRQRDLGE